MKSYTGKTVLRFLRPWRTCFRDKRYSLSPELFGTTAYTHTGRQLPANPSAKRLPPHRTA